MKTWKFSVTNALVTKILVNGTDDFGTPNQLISFAIGQAYEKWPDHYITKMEYEITHDEHNNVIHNWYLYLMPTSEFINQKQITLLLEKLPEI